MGHARRKGANHPLNTILADGCLPEGFKFHPDYRYNVTGDGRLQGDRATCLAAKRGRRVPRFTFL